MEEVRNTLASCEGPMLNSVTKAEHVRFHGQYAAYAVPCCAALH